MFKTCLAPLIPEHVVYSCALAFSSFLLSYLSSRLWMFWPKFRIGNKREYTFSVLNGRTTKAWTLYYATELEASWLNQLFESNNYQSGKQIPSLRSRDRKAVYPLLSRVFRYRSLNLSRAFPSHGGKVSSKRRKLHSRELDNHDSNAFLLLIVWFNLHPTGVGIWSLSRGLWKSEYFSNRKRHNFDTNGIFWKVKQIMRHILKCSQFSCCLYFKKWICMCVFLTSFAYAKAAS